jgi:hypothetical protein
MLGAFGKYPRRQGKCLSAFAAVAFAIEDYWGLRSPARWLTYGATHLGPCLVRVYSQKAPAIVGAFFVLTSLVGGCTSSPLHLKRDPEAGGRGTGRELCAPTSDHLRQRSG